jgi:hypothetical protein
MAMAVRGLEAGIPRLSSTLKISVYCVIVERRAGFCVGADHRKQPLGNGFCVVFRLRFVLCHWATGLSQVAVCDPQY